MLQLRSSYVIVKHRWIEISQKNAIRGDSGQCIIFVKIQYPEVFSSLRTFKVTIYSSFTRIISCEDE